MKLLLTLKNEERYADNLAESLWANPQISPRAGFDAECLMVEVIVVSSWSGGLSIGRWICGKWAQLPLPPLFMTCRGQHFWGSMGRGPGRH